MIELTMDEVLGVHGGRFKMHIDVIATGIAVVAGFITAGPVGAGYVLCSAVAVQGVKSLQHMHQDPQAYKQNNQGIYTQDRYHGGR